VNKVVCEHFIYFLKTEKLIPETNVYRTTYFIIKFTPHSQFIQISKADKTKMHSMLCQWYTHWTCAL